MSINRIYQGRSSGVFTLNKGRRGLEEDDWEAATDADTLLMRHHKVFQDAVCYYMFALGALADREHAEGDPFVAGLRDRLEVAWKEFPREGVAKEANSLRDSLFPWLKRLGLKKDAELSDAFRLLLADNFDRNVGCLALYALLSDLGGESKIQQGGREYFPLFCDAETKANFPRSEAKLLKKEGKEVLPELVWNKTDPESEASLRELKQKLRMEYFALPTTDGRLLEPEAVAKKIEWALERLCEQGRLSDISNWKAKLESLAMPELRAHGAINKDPLQDRFAAWLVFQFVEQSKKTLEALRSTLPEPLERRSREKVYGSRLEAKLADVKEDPILQARGGRGYVFPAFTALPKWNPESAGLPVWKEFDIAAFKEALKGFNQFNQMTDKREEEKATLQSKIDWMVGPEAKPPKESGEEEVVLPPRLIGDGRYERVRELEAVLGKELPEGKFHITRASLRGFRDLKEKWNKLHKDAEGGCSEKDLEAVVKDYQRSGDHIQDIGSVTLFFTLCEKPYWDLWLELNEEQVEELKAEGRAVNILYAVAQMHELEDDLDHKKDPVHLTPAEWRHSRRLYSFSDAMTQKQQKTDLIRAMQKGECAVNLAYGNEDGGFEKKTAKITFKAPRMHRDQLLEDSETRWLQPMMEALALDQAVARSTFKKVALSLMPDWKLEKGEETQRILLNFAVTLEPEELIKAVRKRSLTEVPLGSLEGGQLNGTQDKHIHLHWPETLDKKYRDRAWFEQQGFLVNGLEFLSIDMGQRSAGAWALVRVQCNRPEGERPFLELGEAGDKLWFAVAADFGLIRLSGENDADARKEEQYPTKKGRSASEEEYWEAIQLAQDFGLSSKDSAIKWITPEKKFPEQNDQLIRLAGHRLSRLMTYHQWSCFRPEGIADLEKREKAVEKRSNELAVYAEHEALKEALQTGHIDTFRDLAGRLFYDLRDSLEVHLLALANRVAPLRDRTWLWEIDKGEDSVCGQLVDRGVAPANKPRVMGQRGISMLRIEQLEALRTLFLRYNRALGRKSGEPTKFGREDRGRRSGEPCKALLGKIERIKEERINQTAHLILANALGVRLCRDGKRLRDASERRRRDLHGEYERIPNRRPVDAIVLEDLVSYTTTHDRAPGENKKLMNWAHRSVLEKVKMLAEPFGIPVLEIAAAYSSKFCSRNFQPGFRALDTWDMHDFQVKRLEKRRDEAKADSSEFKSLDAFLKQWSIVRSANQVNRSKDKNAKPLTLLMPKRGGPVFVPIRDGSPMQADINAAVNLGFRASASYAIFKVFSRIRTLRKKERKSTDPVWHLRATKTQQANKREIAIFKHKPVVEMEPNKPLSKQLLKATSPNFFYDPEQFGSFDRGVIKMADGSEIKVSSGVSLWKYVKDHELKRCVDINAKRIEKWRSHGLLPQQDDPTGEEVPL